MNEEDRRMKELEREASPDRFGGQQSSSSAVGAGTEQTEERREAMSRTVTASTMSSSASSSSGESIEREEIGVSRVTTQPDLERHPTALSRIQTGRSIHSATIGASIRSRTTTRHSKTPLPPFGAGKDYPPLLPDREEYVVEFDGPDDPLHAQNWPLSKKLPVCITLGYVTLVASFGSSIFSAALGRVAAEFNLSTEVSVLGVSLYVLGFATGKQIPPVYSFNQADLLGPLMWAPASELYGRKKPLLISSFGFSIFNIAVAVAKDSQTIFICRFFAGKFLRGFKACGVRDSLGLCQALACRPKVQAPLILKPFDVGLFGACPLTCVGAVFADMFSNRQRGLAITVFSMTVFSGMPRLQILAVTSQHTDHSS